MSDAVLLDTCAAIWVASDQTIDATARTAIRDAEMMAEVHISPITAWEIATLSAKGRLSLTMSVEKWFDHLIGMHGTVLADMSPRILINSASLPGEPPSDPADRIVIASARELGLSVITRDQKILRYASAGHVKAIGC